MFFLQEKLTLDCPGIKFRLDVEPIGLSPGGLEIYRFGWEEITLEPWSIQLSRARGTLELKPML